jgi:gamma-glutamylcysteine synthetase
MSEYHNKAFLKFANHWSQEHRDFFVKRHLSTKRRTELDLLAMGSHEKQKQIEASDTMSLQEYVAKYMAG